MTAPTAAAQPDPAMVANRLRKNRARLKGWLKQAHVSCYRVYDADLPEYATAIDVYQPEHDELPWLHVQEYRAPGTIPEPLQRARLAAVLDAATAVFEVPRERLSLKTRERAKGGSKYGVLDERRETLVVREGAARLEVNLFDYLDTGLFLDHRAMRRHINRTAAGVRFLNLFCYTGAATVQAALGGAASTVSVDLSATYLKWAERNLRLNALDGEQHRCVRGDVMRWLETTQETFDLIFCDPPTFSNSKQAADFDVQHDQQRLLAGCLRLLSADGRLLFSNNYRGFKLDRQALKPLAEIDETSDRLRDRDFARNARIHHSFELRPIRAA
ncbi:MAG: class I SAM-dependent methyltransferase [Pseudomonadota bacterium]